MLKKVKRHLSHLIHPSVGEVWMLHRVTNIHANTEFQRTYEITPARLESLIVDYLRKGYSFISIAEVREVMLGNIKLRNKFVSITLDDGYRDNYEVAYPIFKKYNTPFCIYLLQNEVSGDVQGKYPMLTQEQLLELDKEPLCTLGGHTYSHTGLAHLTKEEQFREINSCKLWMEKMLGHKVVDYSYPYGSYNQITLDIMNEIGMNQCPASWGGNVRLRGHSIYEIPRKLVTENSIQ